MSLVRTLPPRSELFRPRVAGYPSDPPLKPCWAGDLAARQGHRIGKRRIGRIGESGTVEGRGAARACYAWPCSRQPPGPPRSRSDETMSATASNSGHRAGDRRGPDTRRGTEIRRSTQDYERELRRHELAVGRSLTQVLPSDRPARLRELADARRALSGAIRDLRQLLRDLQADLQRYGEMRSRNQRELLAYEAVAGEIEEVLERWEARRDQLATALERGGRRPGGQGGGAAGSGAAGRGDRAGQGATGGRPGRANQSNRGGQGNRSGQGNRGNQAGRGEQRQRRDEGRHGGVRNGQDRQGPRGPRGNQGNQGGRGGQGGQRGQGRGSQGGRRP